MKQTRRLLAVAIPSAIVATTVSAALSGTAFAASARPLNLTAVKPQFTSFMCLNASCSLASATVDGKGTSNLSTGAGSYHADLILDFSPGGSCNIATENAVFSFGDGTISVHSHHEDCATAGLRINTTFQVTGGTGAFQGASGDGREFSSVANSAPVVYQGTISF